MRVFSLRCLLLSVACVVLANISPGALAAEGSTKLDQIQAINPLAPAKELNCSEWTCKEWVLGDQRQMDLKPLAASTIVEASNTYYVEEQQSGRWLAGHRNDARGLVQEIHCDRAFENLDELLKATKFADLPQPPEGFAIREVARFARNPSRLTSDGQGKTLYALVGDADVWRIDLATGQQRQILKGIEYIDTSRGDRHTVGLLLDRQRRLYIVVNQRIYKSAPLQNEITIYRTTGFVDGEPAAPKPWLRTFYPWGIGPFNHGVGHLAIGPDGLLYVSSGSRTDGNETGGDPRYSREGEAPLTSCIWRIDPWAEDPLIEVYARGLRNAYGFCWNDRGEMFATDNGPDADPAEELNQIERDGHYGFPFQFADWAKKPYAYTPDPPAGVSFKPPIANLGPDGGYAGKPLYSFDPHSSPSGIVYLGNDFPEGYRGTFLVARFGNLLERPKDVGFDVLQVRLQRNAEGRYEAQMKTVLSPIARPVDLHLGGQGKVYICEYSRQIENKGYSGLLPGRVLELSVLPKP